MSHETCCPKSKRRDITPVLCLFLGLLLCVAAAYNLGTVIGTCPLLPQSDNSEPDVVIMMNSGLVWTGQLVTVGMLLFIIGAILRIGNQLAEKNQ